MLISLDLIIALPILLVAVALLYSTFYSYRAYVFDSDQSQSSFISLYYKSAVIYDAVGGEGYNFSSASSAVDSLNAALGVNASLLSLNLSNSLVCERDFCRILTISSNSYILVLS